LGFQFVHECRAALGSRIGDPKAMIPQRMAQNWRSHKPTRNISFISHTSGSNAAQNP
jgi:hypothetical protein